VRVHSPTESVIGVRIDHFRHIEPNKSIQLFPDDKPIPGAQLEKSKETLKLTTGELTAEVTHNPYTVTFKSPKRTLTFAGYKHQGIYDVPGRWAQNSASNSSCLTNDQSSNPNPDPVPAAVRYVHSELNLSPGELVYGLGEQFGTFTKNGKSIYL
jgi:alpha-glucosidase (family GH31 glycosyl hydrolase)